jgi:hypothetical protein
MPILTVVLGTSIWVLLDTQRIGIGKDPVKGLAEMNAWAWLFACLFPGLLRSRCI